MSTNVFEVRFPGDSSTESNLFDVEAAKSLNRDANSATIIVDDVDGTAKSRYPRGRRLEIYVSTDGGSTFSRLWAGTPVDSKVKDDRGNDLVEVEAVGYDFFLRREEVYKTYTSTLLSDILQDLIENFTPVNYVGGNITVENDTTITQSFEGEKVDTIISELSTESANEDFGVNDDFEFFFEQREITEAPGDVMNTEWLDYDIPTKGKRSVNQIRLFYGSGGNEASIIVEDAAAQTELKNQLNAPRDVVISESVTYPNIDSEDAARRKANEALNNKSEILTGGVITFDRFDFEPGQVFSLEISDQNINEDFRIADIRWEWRRDETSITIAENDDTLTDELLFELANSVDRIDARDADPNAPVTRDLNLLSGVTLELTVDITQYEIDTDAFALGYDRNQLGFNSGFSLGWQVNAAATIRETSTTAVATNNLLNLMRDVWQGESTISLTHLAIGDDSTTPNRTNNTLLNETNRFSLDNTSTGTTSVLYGTSIRFEPSVDGVTLREVGIFDDPSTGDMFMRGTNADVSLTQEKDTRIDITLDIADDSELNGVITNLGQQTLLELLTGLDTDSPINMLYGTGTTTPDVTDTALDTEVFSDTIDTFTDKSIGLSDVIHRIQTGEANGNDIAELGEENTNGDLLSRIVFSAISKTSSISIRTNQQFRVRNN